MSAESHSHWGKLKLVEITDSQKFWYLYDELEKDMSGIVKNRTCLLQAFRNGHLYGLEVEETDEMYDKNEREKNSIFCRSKLGEFSWYLLPCFCVKREDKAMMIWTHSRARKNGFATKLTELLGIKTAYIPLASDSLDFWKARGIEMVY